MKPRALFLAIVATLSLPSYALGPIPASILSTPGSEPAESPFNTFKGRSLIAIGGDNGGLLIGIGNTDDNYEDDGSTGFVGIGSDQYSIVAIGGNPHNSYIGVGRPSDPEFIFPIYGEDSGENAGANNGHVGPNVLGFCTASYQIGGEDQGDKNISGFLADGDKSSCDPFVVIGTTSGSGVVNIGGKNAGGDASDSSLQVVGVGSESSRGVLVGIAHEGDAGIGIGNRGETRLVGVANDGDMADSPFSVGLLSTGNPQTGADSSLSPYFMGQPLSEFLSGLMAEYYPQTAAALDAGDYPGAGSAFIGETLYKIEPEADTNGDGLVSQEEHEAYQSVMVDQFLVEYGDYNEDGTVDQKDVEDWMSDNDLGGDEDEGAFDSFRAVFGDGESDASRDVIAFTAGNGMIDASNALVRGDALGAARDVAQLYLDLISLTVGEGGGRGAVLTAPAEAFLSATEGE